MRQFKIFGFFILFSCWATRVGGGEISGGSDASEDPTSLELRLDEIADAVKRRHPDLKMARWLVEEAKGRLQAAGKLQNPRLVTSFQSDSRAYENQGSFGLNQAFPLAGRLRWEKKVDAALVEAAEFEVNDVARRLVSEAKRLAVRILAIEAEQRLRAKQLELAQAFARTVSELVERAESSVLDLGQAKLEETGLALELHHLDHEAKGLYGKLKTALGVPPECELRLAGGLPEPVAVLLDSLTTSSRPDLAGLVRQAEAAEHEIRLAKSNRWQDVTLGVFANVAREEDRPVGIENEERIGLQLSVPLPVWRRNQGLITEKTAKAARLKQAVEAKENEIRNAIVASLEVMNTLAHHANEVKEELLPEAMRQLVHFEQAYRQGQLGIDVIIRARKQVVEMELKHVEAIEDYHLQRVEYETARGEFD